MKNSALQRTLLAAIYLSTLATPVSHAYGKDTLNRRFAIDDTQYISDSIDELIRGGTIALEKVNDTRLAQEIKLHAALSYYKLLKADLELNQKINKDVTQELGRGGTLIPGTFYAAAIGVETLIAYKMVKNLALNPFFVRDILPLVRVLNTKSKILDGAITENRAYLAAEINSELRLKTVSDEITKLNQELADLESQVDTVKKEISEADQYLKKGTKEIADELADNSNAFNELDKAANLKKEALEARIEELNNKIDDVKGKISAADDLKVRITSGADRIAEQNRIELEISEAELRRRKIAFEKIKMPFSLARQWTGQTIFGFSVLGTIMYFSFKGAQVLIVSEDTLMKMIAELDSRIHQLEQELDSLYQK